MTRTRVRNRRSRRNNRREDGAGLPSRSRTQSDDKTKKLGDYVHKNVGDAGFNKNGSIKARVLWGLALDQGDTPNQIRQQARQLLDQRGLKRIPDRFSPEFIISPDQLGELQRIHMQRSLQAQLVDERMKAKIADSVEEWIKQPNRKDIVGVDYPGENSVSIPQLPALERLRELHTENIPDRPKTNRDGKQPQEHWLPEPLEKELIEMGIRPKDIEDMDEKAPGLFDRILNKKPEVFLDYMDWNDPSLYDLVINTEQLGLDLAAKLIMESARSDQIKACSL